MKKFFIVATILVATGSLYAQSADTSQSVLDSIDTKMKLLKLKEITVSVPRPIYSMTGEVVNYNVEHDPTVAGLTAFDAIRNTPTVSVDEEGNLTMRGSEQVEVWLNGQPTHLSGSLLRAFFEAMPADAVARIEVIKNPNGQYMVADGHHILNIVMSAKMRSSELLILGMSGNTRPYLSPWISYVRNNDRLRLNVHFAASHSHQENSSQGGYALFNDADTASWTRYQSLSAGNNMFGNLFVNASYQIDNATDLSLNTMNMMQGYYDNKTSSQVEQWDNFPDRVHYQYCDSNNSQMLMSSGFASFTLRHQMGRKGQNLRFGGTWNYLFSSTQLLDQRTVYLFEGVQQQMQLLPYDRSSSLHRTNNKLDFSMTYNHPLGEKDQLSLRIGVMPWAGSSGERNVFCFDTTTTTYTLMDTLRSYANNYHSPNATLGISLRHEWSRTTLTASISAQKSWLKIHNTGLFPDDSTQSFFHLVPTLQLTHRTKDMHYLRYRYTLVMNNPSGSNLTKSRIYASDSYTVGNSHLRGSASHRHTFSWNKYHSTLGYMSIDAYGNYTTNGIESITLSTTETDPYLGRLISYTIPVNVASSYKYGLDANLTYRPAAWVSMRLEASLYREGYRLGGEEDPLHTSFNTRALTSWRVTGGLWAKVAKLVNLNMDLNYGSPTLSLFTQQRTALSLSFSSSATLLAGRLSLRLHVSDLLAGNLSQTSIQSPSYSSNRARHSSLRYLTFGLTYRIGKLELQSQVMGGAASE